MLSFSHYFIHHVSIYFSANSVKTVQRMNVKQQKNDTVLMHELLVVTDYYSIFFFTLTSVAVNGKSAGVSNICFPFQEDEERKW